MEQMGFDHSARRVSPLRTETGKQLVPTAQNALVPLHYLGAQDHKTKHCSQKN